MISNINLSASYAIANYMRAYGVDISKSLEKLSSGMSATSPSSNPGTYFISSSLQRRANTAESLADALAYNIEGLQTAEDTLSEIKTLLEDAASLAFKAANEGSATIRTNYGKEYDILVDKAKDLIDEFTFNGDNLLKDLGTSNLDFSVIIEEDSSNTFTYSLLDTNFTAAAGLNLSGYETGAEADFAASQANAQDYYDKVVDTADAGRGLTNVERNLSRASNILSILEGRQATLNNKAANYQAASEGIGGLDSAKEATTLAANQIMQQSSAFFLAQANSNNASVTRLMFGFGD